MSQRGSGQETILQIPIGYIWATSLFTPIYTLN